MYKCIILLLVTLYCRVSAQDSTQLSVSKFWWYEHLQENNIPGISFAEAITLLNEQKPKKEVIIAVLDSDIDINHSVLNRLIWSNTNEIPNDGIDNDNNGFIDDIHGWNFLGRKKDGINLAYNLMEETRILRKYDSATINGLYKARKIPFRYTTLLKEYNKTIDTLKADIELYTGIKYTFDIVRDTLHKYKSSAELDSVYIDTLTSSDNLTQQYIDYIKNYLKNYGKYDQVLEMLDFKTKSLEVCMNREYDNRELVGDDQYDITDIKYGSSTFGKTLDISTHSTEVSSIIAQVIHHLDSLVPNAPTIKIMPIVVTAIGDYTEKDLALAIRYAVDNEADVINFSQSKQFSITEKWIDNAIRYAEKHNVLFVNSAGNDGENIDLPENHQYPDDRNSDGKEIYDNFISVGGSSYQLDKNIVYSDSNYGKENVDLLAPGSKIFTYLPKGETDSESNGTSFSAPIVATVAALIKAYYPDLTAAEVKKILMDSVTKYDVDVEIKEKNEKGEKITKMIPFFQLSKSGGIVNAYNALLLAEKVSKGKEK